MQYGTGSIGRTHLFRHLNWYLWLYLVSPDCLAVRLIAPGVVGVVSPSKVSSCIGAPKQLHVQQPAIVPVSSLCVESAALLSLNGRSHTSSVLLSLVIIAASSLRTRDRMAVFTRTRDQVFVCACVRACVRACGFQQPMRMCMPEYMWWEKKEKKKKTITGQKQPSVV